MNIKKSILPALIRCPVLFKSSHNLPFCLRNSEHSFWPLLSMVCSFIKLSQFSFIRFFSICSTSYSVSILVSFTKYCCTAYIKVDFHHTLVQCFLKWLKFLYMNIYAAFYAKDQTKSHMSSFRDSNLWRKIATGLARALMPSSEARRSLLQKDPLTSAPKITSKIRCQNRWSIGTYKGDSRSKNKWLATI